MKTKKLRCFDFDDTLVRTDSYIYLTKANGNKVTLSPGEFAVYVQKPGDIFDFSDFQDVKNPTEIKTVTNILRQMIKAVGNTAIFILTARGAYKPIKQYIRDIGLPASNIYVVALASADPQDKADWIEDRIKEGFNDIFFIDDSIKNVKAVKNMVKKYPDVKANIRHFKH